MSTKQPETLRIADALLHSIAHYGREDAFTLDAYEAEKCLRRLHAEKEAMRAGYDAARLEIEDLQLRDAERHGHYGAALLEIASLQAQLEAIGAGGVEPLRKRECLHQISEPASGEAERAAFVAYLTEKFPTVYSEGAAEHWWDKGHVSALAWQGRAALAAQAQPAAQALDALRLSFLYSRDRTDSSAVLEMEITWFNGRYPTLEQVRDAIDAAIAGQQGCA